METLTSIIRTGLPNLVERVDMVNSYYFSISNDFNQMVNFPARIPDCGSHNPALLDVFLSCDARICSTMAFPPLGNFDDVVSVSIDFPSNSQRDAPFRCIGYDYSHADWDSLHDHLRDVPWEDIFKLPILHLLIKQKSPSFSRNLALWTFGELPIVFSTKVNLEVNGPEVLSFASDKAKLFAENFSKNSNLDNSGISLPVFTSRTNLKVQDIFITPKVIKKVIMNLDLSKACGPDSIPVVVLKNCEPELSYILAELFNKFLKESCFPGSLIVPVFKNVGQWSAAKNYHPVSRLSVISKVFEKLVNNRINDQQRNVVFLGLLD